MKPGLVRKRVIADVVAGLGDRSDRALVLGEGRVLAHDEDRQGEPALVELGQDRVDEGIEVRGKRLPSRVAVDFHVRPQVVEIEGYACQRLGSVPHGRSFSQVRGVLTSSSAAAGQEGRTWATPLAAAPTPLSSVPARSL